MHRLFSLSLLILFVLTFSGLAVAGGRHDQFDVAEFLNNPTAYGSAIVEVKARVIAINPNSREMELFDSNSKKTILVNLSQLAKSARTTLMRSDVRQVSVTGRANLVAGRIVISADQVLPLTQE